MEVLKESNSNSASNHLNIEAIGHYTCSSKYKSESPRQGVLSEGKGQIQLNAHCNYEQALEDLDGFERIWLVYQFHLNDHWKPKVSPPILGQKNKVGLFSSRSPYRPNPIGLSCVKLENVKGLSIDVSESDLLDQTPILDIKPYMPYADAFPESEMGWPKHQQHKAYTFKMSQVFEEQLHYLTENSSLDLLGFLNAQLTYDPINHHKKRITCLSPSEKEYIIAYRTWRIRFQIMESNILELLSISSGYRQTELNQTDDPYLDKELHRNFLKTFN